MIIRSCLLCAVVTLASAADPLVLLDREVVIDGSMPSWDYRPGLPRDWTAPVDYSTGALYIEWEVLEAPAGSEELTLQIGWTFPGGGDRPFHVTRYKYLHLFPGPWERPWLKQGATYTTYHKLNNDRCFWPLDPKDYSRGIGSMKTFLRAKDWSVVGPPGPIRVHITMTVVADGDTYQPPTAFGALRTGDIPDLPAVVAAMQQRKPGTALAAAETAAIAGGEGERTRQAEHAVTQLNAWLDGQLQELDARFGEDPVAVYQAWQGLAADFAGTVRVADIQGRLDAHKRSDVLQAELKAHRVLLAMEELSFEIERAVGDDDLSDPAVQARHAQALRKLVGAYEQLVRRYSNSASRRKARDLLIGMGLEPPE